MDAEGRHNEALILLNQAADAGDLEAATQLGKRLLLGKLAPQLQTRGAELLLDAAQKNHPEAVAAMAILQVLGVKQRQSWPDALRSMSYAARLGWDPARRQLLLLAEEKPEGDVRQWLNDRDDAYWQQLGDSIDIDRWLRMPSGAVLSDSPMLVSFDDFLSPMLCEFFIVNAGPRLHPAHDPDPRNMRNANAERSSYALAPFGLLENDFIHFLVQARMAKVCGVERDQLEGMAVLRYRPGDEFSEHCDYLDPERDREQLQVYGQRVMSFLIYLNDDYTGGETVFGELGISHKGSRGQGLYYVNARDANSTDPRTRHAGSPVESGTKWVLSQYVRDRALNFLR